MPLTVAELWRYPVKSLAGEAIDETRLDGTGIPGDRIVHVAGAEGIRTARRHHALLGLHGSLGPDGEPLVDGLPWQAPTVSDRVRAAAGPDALLIRSGQDDRFDVLPLLVATDGAIAAFGRDGRRLRPNIVIGGVEGLAERGWATAELRIGDVVIGLHSLRARCPMTTIDPDTLERDPGVLKDIGRRFGGRLALNAWVVRGGSLHVGDAVEVRPGSGCGEVGR